MITNEQINEWKTKYKKVYKITIGGEDFYFRPLDRTTYIEIGTKMASNKDFDYELETCKACLLNGTEDLEILSGIATVISGEIMLKSGFEEVVSEAL